LKKKEQSMRSLLLFPVSCLVSLLVSATAARAQAPDEVDAAEGVFELGQVTVTGKREQDGTGDGRIGAEEIWNFNVNTLTDAVKRVPGVTSSFVSNGRRNEGDISVRGFDRWRVPLSIDGIRVYLPADNRIDFNRFLTPDLGEVQLRKGYVSVLDGPGALGGSVNLVTRKPVKAFEAEFQGGASFDRSGDYEGWFGTAIAGTRQDSWYLQGSATETRRDHWTLSKDFTPVGPAEDGGERGGSDTRDWRVNVKAGYTPNDTDEYSLSFTQQSGEKNAPLGVDFLLPNGTVQNPPYQPNSYWTWPYWDLQSVYWLSQTQLGETSYLKTRLFYNEFDNLLSAWDDGTYTTQAANGRFNSYYADSSLGGSVEAGSSFFADSTTRAAFHWRRDRHSEYNANRPSHATLSSVEPEQHSEEQTWSLALEHSVTLTPAVNLVGGISYDRNELKQAQEYNTTDGLYDNPTGGSNAFNGQAALQWSYVDNAQVNASVSSRTRFPNNFERFSTRFGNAVANPDLGTERATHFELGWKGAPVDRLTVEVSAFYADVQDMIQTVIVQASPQLTQTQNVGDGSFHGVELAGDWRVSSQLRVGAHYSRLHRRIEDPLQPGLKPTGVPDHTGFAYVAWQPLASLSVQPSVEFAGNRWTDRNGNAGLGYQRLGRHTLANLQLTWRPIESLEAVLVARNLLDENFQLAAGFPEPGRSLFTKVRLKF
jgi:iron complex outermembrane receptor protein